MRLIYKSVCATIALTLCFLAFKWGGYYLIDKYPNLDFHKYSRVDNYDEYKDLQVKAKYNILVTIDTMDTSICSGEVEMAKRILLSAKKLGWDAKLVLDSAMHDDESVDFAVSVVPLLKKELTKSSYKHYVIINADAFRVFNKHCWYHKIIPVKDKYKSFKNYDGFLYSFKEGNLLQNYIESTGKKFYGFPFYPYSTRRDVDFNIDSYNDIKLYFIKGFNWNKLRGSEKYNRFYQMLGNKGYAHFYGPKKGYKYLDTDNGWRGPISTNGKDFFELADKYPVSLILHSDVHFNNGIATLRSFESIAAGNLVISDNHEFMRENFKDSVLYVDISKSAEDMVKQVDQHMQWIRNNPKQAMAKAQQAHQIFLEKFTLEDNLLKIARMHEKILLDETKNNTK